MMTYKDYVGDVLFDAESRTFHGHVLGLNAVITFQGTSVEELEQAFKDSVADYLEWCTERGKEPERTYSGNLRLRMDRELHAKLAKEAARQGISLNALITDTLRRNI